MCASPPPSQFSPRNSARTLSSTLRPSLDNNRLDHVCAAAIASALQHNDSLEVLR